jgi:hypothetical protein
LNQKSGRAGIRFIGPEPSSIAPTRGRNASSGKLFPVVALRIDDEEETSPELKAFFARMISPRDE